jgi:hypothetical protein
VLELTSREAAGASAERQRAGSWWALGDAPVRVAQTLVPLVDGRAAMLAMCAAFLTAKTSIRLADWGLYARLRMVRGADLRAGPDDAEEQHALIDRLRAAGLGREAIALWESGPLRVVDVLGVAARHGVDVQVLLWSPFNPGGTLHHAGAQGESQKRGQKAPRLQPGDAWPIPWHTENTRALLCAGETATRAGQTRSPHHPRKRVLAARGTWPCWSEAGCHRSARRRRSAGGRVA